MKLLCLLSCLLLLACGRESSPEGRLTIQIEQLHNKIDTLKMEHQALKDSVVKWKALLEQNRAR